MEQYRTPLNLPISSDSAVRSCIRMEGLCYLDTEQTIEKQLRSNMRSGGFRSLVSGRLVTRFLILVIVSPALLLATSCGTEIVPQEPEVEMQGVEQPTVEQPLVFKATMEPETKTAMQSDGSVYWSAGDEISVNGVIFETQQGGAAAADFVKKDALAAAPSAPFEAYYPASVWSASAGDTGGAGQSAGAGASVAAGTPELPAEQLYEAAKPGANLPMRAFASVGTTLNFRNLCAVIKITASSAKALQSIRLEADQPLSGPFTVAQDGSAVLASATGAPRVKLLCGGADISTAKDFYIAVPAGTYTNFKIVFTATDGMFTTKSLKSSLTVARNTLYVMNFSSPIAMDKSLPVVYYGADGGTYSTPQSVTVPEDTDFMLTLENIDWQAGDVLESSVEYSQSELSEYVFMFGGPNGYSNGSRVITGNAGYTGSGWINIKSGRMVLAPGNCITSCNLVFRFSSAGFEYIKNGETAFSHLTTTGQTEQAEYEALVEEILARGTHENPLYFGWYLKMNNPGAKHKPITFNYIKHYSSNSSSGPGTGGDEPGGEQPGGDEPGGDDPVIDEPGEYEDVDDPGIDASDVIYFTRTGHKKFNPAGFDVEFKKNGSATNGYNFKITGINWSAGDELEIAIRATLETGGMIVNIGEDLTKVSNIYGSNHVYLNPQANGYWWNMYNSRNQNIFGANQFSPYNPYPDSVVGCIKITVMDGLPVLQYKSNDLDTWHNATGGEFAKYLGNVMTLTDLYIGSHPSEDSSGHIVYIKWTKAGTFTAGEGGESYAGGTIDITNPGTSW